MKLLFIINSLQGGGAERVIVRVAEGLRERGHDTALLLFRKPELQGSHSIRTLTLDLERTSRIKTLLEIPKLIAGTRRYLMSEAPDAVISFMDQNNLIALLAAMGLKIPVIVSERVAPQHSSLTELPAPLASAAGWLRTVLYARAHHVVVQTEALAKELVAKGLHRTVIIPNAVPPPSAREREMRALGADGPPTVVSLARLVPQKRVDLIIDAFAVAGRQFPDWRLAIFGEGPLKEGLLDQTRARGIEHKVDFYGPTNTPLAALATGSVFVLASDFEGFPNALLEAMSLGLCCISSRCPYGPEEIINDGTDGILFSRGERDELATSLAAAMGNATLRKRLGAAAKVASQRFNEPAIMDRWEALLVPSV